MSKSKSHAAGETPSEEIAAPQAEPGAVGDVTPAAPPFTLGDPLAIPDGPAPVVDEVAAAKASNAPLFKFRVRFDLNTPIELPEAIYEAEDEGAAIAAHRRRNGLGVVMAGPITCTRID